VPVTGLLYLLIDIFNFSCLCPEKCVSFYRIHLSAKANFDPVFLRESRKYDLSPRVILSPILSLFIFFAIYSVFKIIFLKPETLLDLLSDFHDEEVATLLCVCV